MGFRFKIASLHFIGSSVVVAILAAVVFFVWYPPPYSRISGGGLLFLMVFTVDVVLGPLLTALIASRNKARVELCRDLFFIFIVQLSALGYGGWSLYQARPVYTVFEVDRFRVVRAADLEAAMLEQAPKEFRQLSISGPVLIGTRRASSAEEVLQGIDDALRGFDLAMQPQRWVAYDQVRAQVVERAVQLDALMERRPAERKVFDGVVQALGLKARSIKVLPLASRMSSWSVLINEQGWPVGYVPVDLL
ncbi:TfpX/TfpZ family type IV pilin accessory protein [Pseudomonas sp. MBLB4136]|uniref:TfpX/TfpZ family type IV pilin accessory protein n=1 Tax=Pseudomonas sp. MBLB4136 TaxID=3451558 RepID=UPI003F7530F3